MAQATDLQRAARPPLEGAREAPFFMRKADGDEPSDGLTLDGYAAVFGSETIIDSREGRFKEKIALGSMKKSFREAPPKIQFDHGRHPLLGSWAIAELRSITEDSDPVLAPNGGAHVIGRIFDRWYTEPVRDGITAGAIDGMSFRFSVVREEWADATGKVIRDEAMLQELLRRSWYEDVPDEELLIRTLKELKVPEMGPVMWPAYADTSVSVRSVIDLGRLHEPEQRKLLVKAVSIVDAAESQDDNAPHVTDEESAGEHPSTSDDAPRSTDVPSAGEHPSKPRGRRSIDITLRSVRDMLLQIDKKGTP